MNQNNTPAQMTRREQFIVTILQGMLAGKWPAANTMLVTSAIKLADELIRQLDELKK